METNNTSEPKIIKIVNNAKNGIYLYNAIVLIDGIYYWTKSKLLKNKKDKYTFDFLSLPLQSKLNDYSIAKYITVFNQP